MEKEEGLSVDLPCLSAQTPTYTEAKWYHKVTGGRDRFLQTVSWGHDPTLSLLRRASLEDAGEYRCDVLDHGGRVLDTSTVRLDVYGKLIARWSDTTLISCHVLYFYKVIYFSFPLPVLLI